MNDSKQRMDTGYGRLLTMPPLGNGRNYISKQYLVKKQTRQLIQPIWLKMYHKYEPINKMPA